MHRWGTVAHGNTGEAVSELLKAAERGDLATLKRLFADKAALAEGEEIAERDQYGRTPLLRAASYGRITVVEWLLTDGRSTMSEADHNGDMVWSHLKRHIRRAADVTLSSLLRHMVLLEDAPPAFLLFLVLEPQHKQIIFEGRQLRAQLLDHLEHLRTMLMRRCPLPSVLQPLIAAYAAPTTEDMWTIWWASTDFKVNVVQTESGEAEQSVPLPAGSLPAIVLADGEDHQWRDCCRQRPTCPGCGPGAHNSNTKQDGAHPAEQRRGTPE